MRYAEVCGGETWYSPRARRLRYVEEFGIPLEHARQLTARREISDYYEAVVDVCGEPKLAATMLMRALGMGFRVERVA